MGASDRKRSTLLALLALPLTLAGCSGGPDVDLEFQPTQAKAEIEHTKQAAESGEAAALPGAPDPVVEEAPPAAPEVAKPIDPTAPIHFKTAVVEEPAPVKPTLFEAAEAERQRRVRAGSAAIVITDDNLANYAKAGNLTEMITHGVTPDASTSGEAEAPSEVDRETYWRIRVRDARLAWRAAADRIGELERQVAQLRYDFYSHDDPFYRDSQIKPAWDRTAVEVEQARLRARDLESQVRRVLEEGWAEGALPGWLREGIDFEPESAKERQGGQAAPPEAAEVIEPPIYEVPPV